MARIRLDRLLSGQGMGTRREIRILVKAGAVQVNGKTAAAADVRVDTDRDRVTVSGRPVDYKEHVYIMMNKPCGVVSASVDPRERTVIDLLPEALRRPGLFPVGRLDKDTEGLLLITDDGPFAHEVLSPRRHVGKRYFACLDVPADAADAAAFREGILLEDGTICRPAGLEIRKEGVYVTIFEGRYHQIKRMFEARGKTVVYLRRLSMGALRLDEALPPGGVKELSHTEALTAKSGI